MKTPTTVLSQASFVTRRSAVCVLVVGAALLRAPPTVAQVGAPSRIGWVSVFPLAQVEVYLAAFKNGLAAQGLVEGRDVIVDAVSADGDVGRLPGIVDALAGRRPEVIVAQGGAIFAVRRVKDIPVVFGFSGDPVAAELTDSLARPSGNLTGITFMQVDLNGKRIELLREFKPAARRVVLMGDPVHPGVDLEVEATLTTARSLGIEVRWAPTRDVREVRALLTSLGGDPPDAVLVLPDSVMLESRAEVAAFAIRHRLPAVSGWSQFAHSGGLFTYGPRLTESFRRLADYVARVHRGAKPADLPVERPSRLELVVNAKTAAALGLSPPSALLARADEVIE